MTDVTKILSQIEQGDPSASEELLPLVYEELRRLAAQKLSNEKPGQTLQGTALVHDAYLRLVGAENAQQWDSRRHFFSAAAEAMRRILVENARRKGSVKHGGMLVREELDDINVFDPEPDENLCDLDHAIKKLKGVDAQAAKLVDLRYFAGLTLKQTADILDISPRTADRVWGYARAWLLKEMRGK